MSYHVPGNAEVRVQEPSEASIVAVSLVVAGALFMQGLDGVILNTSLPQMAASLTVRSVELNTVITSYVLAVAVATPVTGWIVERCGAKRVLAGAIALFTIASIGCGVANSLPELIIARVLQGAGGAFMWPVGRLVTLRGGKASLMRSTALVIWPALIAPVVGPVVGAAITSFLGWRWNFFLNLPLGIVGISLTLLIVPDMRNQVARKPLDIIGALLSGITLFLFVFGIGQLGVERNLWLTLGLLGSSVIMGVASLIWFKTCPYPLLEFSPLKVPTFYISRVGGGNLFSIAISVSPFLLPLMLQQIWGLSPLASGAWLLDYFAGNLLLKALTTPTLRRFGFRRVIVGSGIGITVSIAACGFLSASTSPLILGLVLFAAGGVRSMQFTALGTLSFADIERNQRTSATTLHTLSVQLSHIVGIALAAAALNLSQYSRAGASLSQADFRNAFLFFALISALGTLMCLDIHPKAGAEVTGHGTAEDAEPQT